MSETNVEFTTATINPWDNLSTGGKLATILAGLAVAAASVAASIFMAGAVLFAGAVFAIYQWLSGRSDHGNPERDLVKPDNSADVPQTADNSST